MSLAVGDTLKPFRIESVSPEGMKAWAVFLRDPNPIHLDPAVVKAKGLGDRVINQGPANLAYIMSMLQAAHPQASIETLEIRYVDNVFGGEAVEASGKVIAVEHTASALKATCEIALNVQGRGPAITGTAVLAIPFTG